jgi:hypothetical protein
VWWLDTNISENPEDGGSMILWNNGTQPPSYTVQQPRKPQILSSHSGKLATHFYIMPRSRKYEVLPPCTLYAWREWSLGRGTLYWCNHGNGLTHLIFHYKLVHQCSWRSLVFEFKREEVTGEWRKLHNERFQTLYSLTNITKLSRSRRVRWM